MFARCATAGITSVAALSFICRSNGVTAAGLCLFYAARVTFNLALHVGGLAAPTRAATHCRGAAAARVAHRRSKGAAAARVTTGTATDAASSGHEVANARAAAAAMPGGTGTRFDWSLLKDHRHSMDWGIAGGLTPENVAEAISATGAPLVDVSSGVESAPGVKDVDKIAAFLKAAGQ